MLKLREGGGGDLYLGERSLDTQCICLFRFIGKIFLNFQKYLYLSIGQTQEECMFGELMQNVVYPQNHDYFLVAQALARSSLAR